MSDPELNGALVAVNAELEHLKARVRDLERERSNAPSSPLPDTLLLSHDFMKRAFTVWGHNLVAGLIVGIPLWCIFFFIGLVTSGN
jgi:hypothetical protein